MGDSKQGVKPADTEADEGGMSEAEIDQNLKDTFSASDPPSWTLGTNHGQASHGDSDNLPGGSVEDSESE